MLPFTQPKRQSENGTGYASTVSATTKVKQRTPSASMPARAVVKPGGQKRTK